MRIATVKSIFCVYNSVDSLTHDGHSCTFEFRKIVHFWEHSRIPSPLVPSFQVLKFLSLWSLSLGSSVYNSLP